MSRKVNAGIVWKPSEVILLLVAAALAIVLVWIIHETNRQNLAVSKTWQTVQPQDDSMPYIIKKEVQAERKFDERYDEWVSGYPSALEAIADDVGSIYDESTY